MAYYFVTSFNKEQYDSYGSDMLASFKKAVPAKLKTNVFMLECDTSVLEKDIEYRNFLARYSKFPWAHGIMRDGKANYRYQAIRFCHKVFAYTNPGRSFTPDDWWIWLDADTKFTGEMTQEWLDRVCPKGKSGTYIGRQDWDHSECGWVAWNMGIRGCEFLEKMRYMYTSGLVFGLPQWHDSYVFDVVRQSMELRYGERWVNLAKGIGGNHPWPDTVLGEIIEHYKGPAAKQEQFGEVV